MVELFLFTLYMFVNCFTSNTCTLCYRDEGDEFEMIFCYLSHAINSSCLLVCYKCECFIMVVIVWCVIVSWLGYHVWYTYYRLARIPCLVQDISWLIWVPCVVHIIDWLGHHTWYGISINCLEYHACYRFYIEWLGITLGYTCNYLCVGFMSKSGWFYCNVVEHLCCDC